jgi:hypothetical protein
MHPQRKPIGLSIPHRKVKQESKRTWVSLTNKEVWQLVNDCTIGGDLHADKFAKAIDVKLKEKNT